MCQGWKGFSIWLLTLLLFTALCACQTSTPPPTPTIQPTPTITPTPAPQAMEIDTLLQNCASLDEQDATVILTGRVFMPDEAVYGYEGWYGMNLVSGPRINVLFQVGTGANTMDDLPPYFFEQDLVIRAYDNKIIRHGHEVRVTGRPKYRADSETRRCELFADRVESLMPADVLQPVDLTIEELNDGDTVNDCSDLEFSRQFVRLTGLLRIDEYTSLCQVKKCKVTFEDSTGSAAVMILEGEGPNHMLTLPEVFTSQDLKIFDQNGDLVDNTHVSLVGVAALSDNKECKMIVYEVEKGE